MLKEQKGIPVGILFIFLTYLCPNGYAELPHFFTDSGKYKTHCVGTNEILI